MTAESGAKAGVSQNPGLSPQTLAELRAVAEHAARAGGAVARAAFDRPPGVRLKDDASVVTDADIAAQVAVIATIRAARPDDVCIGEESTDDTAVDRGARSNIQNPESNIAWLIDPIDGTRNFVRGAGAFACSVGALHNGTPIAGAIYEPLRDLMYSGDLVSGLHVNGAAQLAPGARHDRGPDGPAGEIVVSLPSSATPRVAAIMHACVDRCVIRNLGSAALHLAMVATGQIDAAVMATCKLWDLAAGAALVAATGGVIVELDGRPLFPIDVERRAAEELPSLVARNATILERIVRLLPQGRLSHSAS